MFQKALREYEAVHTDDEASCCGVDLRRFSRGRPLAGDYVYNFSTVAPLYAGDPASPAAWREAIARTQQHPRQRSTVAAVLRAQQERRGAPAAARAASVLLADPNTVAVVTGQQAGAFGGPLFTLLKAVTAVQLARRTSAEHAVPAVAIFWVDAEDHDWDEVRSTTILDVALHPRTITVPELAGAGRLPVAALTLDEGVTSAIAALQETLPPTDFTLQLVADLKAAWQPGTGMAEAFARWLESLLGPHGLIVFDSADPAAKSCVADLFARELQFPGRTAALATEAGRTLAALGHQPQVEPHADTVALFRLDGARTPIRRQGESLVIGDRTHSPESLAADAVDHPERFSPNVLLRPVVQDAIFPTVCYVAGPSELAYLGQLKGVYEHFGVPMPLIQPRATATLVDSATRRFLKRYNVPLEELQPQDEAALNRLLQSQLPASVEQALADAGTSVRRSLERVIEVIPAVDPTLARASATTLGKMEHLLRGLENKVIHAAKKRDETLRRQFAHAQAHVFPLGHPQERTLGGIFFLNRYGPALIPRLIAELPVELGKHWIITI
jgi:bacillithiol biosynthesis cysteine-adding enzyme BshC